MQRRELLLGSAALLLATACKPAGRRVSIGTKNFTEQLVLGEILAQMLEHHIALPVERRFYLAGTYICQQAILAGRIDAYVEYTGTALAAVLEAAGANRFQDGLRKSAAGVSVAIRPRGACLRSASTTPSPSPSAATTRSRWDLSKLSDLAAHAPQMRLGVGYEFLEREDGFPGLAKTYGLKFAAPPSVMDLGLLYRALEAKQVDIVAGSNTDGLIAAFGLVVLEDDKHYFPPYDAVPIVRPQALREFRNGSRRFNNSADASPPKTCAA